ncbi:hypothetical protein ZOSMA_278G00200 [Zostera marina]|uniref:Uncharacterized protein n=1 Tax=Zostera marina TaxID=29655 RepID=A0A0K9PDV4_ZOSMR|nr:hypothetical protein ZOSMA_278G00200 [Zostera marina]
MHNGDNGAKENARVRLKNDQVPSPLSSSSSLESGDSNAGKKKNMDAEESLQKAMFVSCWSLN